MTFEITVTLPEGTLRTHSVQISRDAGQFHCSLDGKEVPLDVVTAKDGVLSLLIDGRSYEIRRDGDKVGVNGFTYVAEVRDPRSLRARRRAADTADGPKKVTAPMPGKVVRILVGEGNAVEAGQGIVVIEAMKMQNEMKSPKAGVVKKIAVKEGAAVNPGDTLAIVE
jgi:biotin carboxyl carrier protein